MQREKLRDKYFLGTLTHDEQRALNVELEKDDRFREEFEKMQEDEVELAVKHSYREDVAAELRPQMLDWEKEIRKGSGSGWRYMSIAASLLIVIGLAWYMTTIGSSSSLYDDYYDPYPNSEVMITRDSPDNIQIRAFSAFESGDYELAQSLFTQMNDEGPEVYLDFYLGITAMELENDDTAIAHFSEVIAARDRYHSEALWYRALSRMRSGDISNAIIDLENLVGKQDFKEKEARELLDKLHQ